MKGIEVSKMHQDRMESGFYAKYMSGHGLDIGFKGLGLPDGMEPVLPNATGVDLDYPGYDGVMLPFASESQDYVFASHVLEHIVEWQTALWEWHRVVRVGGCVIILVPHCYLYERSFTIPGPWGSCADHKRTYTPGFLLREIEAALELNSYRIVSLRDNDKNFIYERPVTQHPDFFNECFEIECVLQKIKKPSWDVI